MNIKIGNGDAFQRNPETQTQTWQLMKLLANNDHSDHKFYIG